jgi:hypothetical protein
VATPCSIQRRHAVNSPVVRCDVSVPAEGKRAVSPASKTQTVLTALTYTELKCVDTGSRHTGPYQVLMHCGTYSNVPTGTD